MVLQTKKKVYGYGKTPERQFYLLMAILTALGVGQGGNPTRYNSYAQNVRVQVILQNSLKKVRALHRPHSNKLLGFYQAEGAGGALPYTNDSNFHIEPIEDLGTAIATETDGEAADRSTSLCETTLTHLAVVRYHSSGENDDETVSPGQAEEINRQVEPVLDESVKSILNTDIEDIPFETLFV
ncbi:unnamed protein product [Clonostachys solani]|uniref:Uncharacterized protein n=1 Tax=Clonostachys solani TaxID=160281 RepID=A0A9N9Z5J2_9HYPO|nr:unnamed protein product [Clonostachys solani]